MKKILWIAIYLAAFGFPGLVECQNTNISDSRYGNIIIPYPNQTLFLTSAAQSIEVTTDAAPEGLEALFALEDDLNEQLSYMRNPGVHASLDFEDGDRCYITLEFDEYIYGDGSRRIYLGSGLSIIQFRRGYDYPERPAKTMIEIKPEEKPSITLKNTTAGKTYTLTRNGELIATKTATGNTLTFDNLPTGSAAYLFGAAASFPITVSVVLLYGIQLRTDGSYSTTLPASGGVAQINFYSAADERSLWNDLGWLVRNINAGEYDYWNTDIKIEVADLGVSGDRHNYRFDLTCGPNLSSESILNRTRLGNQTGSEFTVMQNGGGSLQRQAAIVFDKTSGQVKASVSESQHLVEYKLLQNNMPVATAIGNGNDITLTGKNPNGDYQITAKYKDQSLVLCTKRLLGGIEININKNANWIASTMYTDGNQSAVDITYFDGLGYPSQYIQINGTPDGNKDIVQPLYYDTKLRESRTYLPYVVNANIGKDRFNAIVEQRNYLGTNAYTENLYDNSPLDRITKSYQPGEIFRTKNKASLFTYDVCSQDEVIRLDVDDNGNLKQNGY